jgi:hypothetical protein
LPKETNQRKGSLITCLPAADSQFEMEICGGCGTRHAFSVTQTVLAFIPQTSISNWQRDNGVND